VLGSYYSLCCRAVWYCSHHWLDIPELLLTTCLLVLCLVASGVISQNQKCQILMSVTLHCYWA